MPGGRPLKYGNCWDLDELCFAYFEECDENKDPYTITGLALALETTRKTLIEYAEKPEFVNTIKYYKTMVENYAEKKLYTGNATGPIFALKNFDWSDRQEHQLTGKDEGPIEVKHTSLDLDGAKEAFNG